jgi:sugar phosphate isomerase/epimerase
MTNKLTRREWHRLVLGGLGASALAPTARGADKKIDSRFQGVLIGAQSYSFRDRPLDKVVDAMAAVPLGETELWQGHVEPRPDPARLQQMSAAEKAESREKLRQWRLTTPLSTFHEIGEKFRAAGIDPYAYNYSFQDDFTDAEIDRGFEMAKALGAKVITASSNQKTVPRIAAAAMRHKMRVGMHNHSRIDPNEFATAADLEKAMATSEHICTNLDIGHFTAANQDPVGFLKKHHHRIVTLHVKDRKKNQGENMPFGEGNTPIKEVLVLLKQNKWPIPANIEYEYKGGDTVEEVRRCLAYCKKALEA